jgi:hypothetical protein
VTDEKIPGVDPKTFDVVDPKDPAGKRRLVSLGYDVVMYSWESFARVTAGILHAYEKFLSLVPKSELRWYGTENMGRHGPVTPKVLDMLPGWFKKGAPKRPEYMLELRDGEGHALDPARYAFWVWAAPEDSPQCRGRSNFLRLTLPAEWGITRSGEALELVRDLAAHFPFRSGHSGFVLQTTWYGKPASELAAWKLGMRFHGVDIRREVTDRLAVKKDSVKGVNWLTLLSEDLAEKVGGVAGLRKKLPPSVELVPVKGGVIVKAGPRPSVGDVNRRETLPDYRAAYRLLARLQKPVVESYTGFPLKEADPSEGTAAWLERLAEKPK